MRRPAVFFDRDNTLITCDEYLGDPSKVALVTGAADAVARARSLGYATVIVSNQSGVARGYFPESAVHAVNSRLDEMLADENPKALIDRHEYCPFHPDASIEKYRSESPLRKPAPGMLLSAAEALALDLSRSWLIGDAPRDIEAGAAAGCRTILFVDPSLKSSPAALAERKVEPDYVCTTLKEALDFVAQNTERSGEEDAMTDDEVALVATSAKAQATAEPVQEPAVVATPVAANPVVEKGAAVPVEKALTVETSPKTATVTSARLESLAEQILYEVRRRHEQPVSDFSVSKLMAGVVQVIVLFVLFLAYLNRNESGLIAMLLFALTLQTMTIALLIMGKQR